MQEYGAPERIRTSDRLVRSQVLYPAELRARVVSQTCLVMRMRIVYATPGYYNQK